MSVRIRKLARELDRNPVELIGVLHALGFQRYRSADDMLTPVVEAKLRRGISQGVRPVDVDGVVHEVRTPDSVEAIADGGRDLMAELVPGAVRTGARPRPAAPPARAATPPSPRPPPGRAAPTSAAASTPPRHAEPVDHREPPRPEPVDDVAGSVELERAVIESARRTLASERAVLEAERAEFELDKRRVAARARSLDGDRAALDELRAALERERAQLETERAALGALQHRAAPALVSLQELLDARGLRGSDEHERALVALARGRHLRDVLWAIGVEAPDELARILDERLVLVSGDAPETVTKGAAVVAVAPERADLPDTVTLDRQLAVLGERILLHGHRRLLVAGGRSRWHRLFRERLEPRIEARYVPGGLRTRAMATDDVAWADLVVLWGVSVDEEARAIYRAGRATVVEVEGDGLSRFFESILAALPS
jgi:hypothetical protein